ncbi:hypothetical protein PF003_g30771 [Phytophthora fragariae]|nr:hypothetical protein PF003_g30771 [Phytophthora fragariae]
MQGRRSYARAEFGPPPACEGRGFPSRYQRSLPGLNTERNRLIKDRDDAVQSLKHIQSRASHHEAEIAKVGQIRQERDEFRQEQIQLRQEQGKFATQVTQLTAELDQLSHDQDAAISKRDEAIREGQKYYDSSRDLLAQIANMQHSYRLVRQDFDRVQDQHDSLRRERQDLLSSYASIAGERDCALDRLASIAPTALHGTPADAVGKLLLPLQTPVHPRSGRAVRLLWRIQIPTLASEPVPIRLLLTPALPLPFRILLRVDVPASMPFLAIDLSTEDGGSDYEFPGSDYSSSGDESEVGSTHSSVGVDTPFLPCQPRTLKSGCICGTPGSGEFRAPSPCNCLWSGAPPSIVL